MRIREGHFRLDRPRDAKSTHLIAWKAIRPLLLSGDDERDLFAETDLLEDVQPLEHDILASEKAKTLKARLVRIKPQKLETRRCQ